MESAHSAPSRVRARVKCRFCRGCKGDRIAGRLWLLVDAGLFNTDGPKAVLDILPAMTENEMVLLGDVMIGTVPPLEFVIDVEEEKSTSQPDGTRLANVRIKRARIAAAGRILRRPTEQRLAFYIMWNGKWPDAQNDRFEDGKVVQIRCRFEPEEWPQEQGFAIVGSYSELFSRSFLMRTSVDGEVRRFNAGLDPRAEGFEIPESYVGDRLPLWRLRVLPRGGGTTGDRGETEAEASSA